MSILVTMILEICVEMKIWMALSFHHKNTCDHDDFPLHINLSDFVSRLVIALLFVLFTSPEEQ